MPEINEPNEPNEPKEPEPKKSEPKESEPKEPEPKEFDTFTLKVDGVDKSFTLDELKSAASESTGAQKKFEEAAEMMKNAAPGRRVMELVTELGKQKVPDEGKVTELLQLLGVEPSAMEKTMEELKKVAGTNTKKTGDKTDDESGTTSEFVGVENLDPRLKTIMEAAEQADLERIREKIIDGTKKGVDEDKILGKIIDGVPEGKERDKVRQVFHNMAINSVRGKILAREPYGTEMVQSTLQEVRAWIESLGIPGKAAGQPPISGELGSLLSDYGPDVRVTEPIKRVPSTEPGYEENIVKRVQQRIVEAMRKSGRRI